MKSTSFHQIRGGLLALSMMSLLLTACLRPMEPAALAESTVPHLGCEVDFRKSLFDNLFKNLAQGRELPSAAQLEPYLAEELKKLNIEKGVQNEHLSQIKDAYLKVYDTLLRYRDKDLGVPGSYGHWLADIERGDYLNDQQSQWGKELSSDLHQLNQATAILDSKCAERAAKRTPSIPTSNSAFFLSVETLKNRGSEELLRERAENPYFERGYLQQPARIYTNSDETRPSSSPKDSGEQSLTRGSVEEDLLELTPTNWSPLQAHVNIVIEPPGDNVPKVSANPIAGAQETPFVENLFRSYHPAFAGALKTMAVLYQSCNVLDLPLVHGQNSSPLAGLQYVRTDNIFRSHIYRIADVPRFSGTHYYLSQVDQSHDPELKQCRDTKAEFPSMYVYSGTADVTVVDAGQEEISAINLFRQSSSSAEEVGLDCSAFVSVAYQAGGLKFKEGDQCRPYDRIGSTVSFINYKNNLNCMFEPQKDELNTYSDTGPVDLFTGDVFTIGNYHTVIIGQVGYDGEIPDPFRLRRFTDISQCRLENFGYDVFDFDIIHSVASRSQPGTAPYTGLGVSRHHAGTYFRSDPTMGRHMRNYAVAACKRKFSPTAEPYRAGNMNILRHKAVPECMCEERAVLYKQSCLSGCPSPGN